MGQIVLESEPITLKLEPEPKHLCAWRWSPKFEFRFHSPAGDCVLNPFLEGNYEKFKLLFEI